MHRVDSQSASIARFREIGGVVRFVVFDDADGGPDAAYAAILAVFPEANAEELRRIGFRSIDDATFYGEAYDGESDSLLKIGEWGDGADGRLINPKVRDLSSLSLAGGYSPPECGSGGNFAHAFLNPPYGLRAKPQEVQDLFDKIRHFIMPAGLEHEILDWTSPELPKVSAYFETGMEFWGVFLFTIYVPALRRLTVAYASTTD